MKTPAPLSVCIVGAGGIARSHARACREVEGVRLDAVCDVSPEALVRFGERWGVDPARRYASLDALLERERPDIAVVATREIGDHHRLVLDAVERDCHIYLEKPIAAAPAEVDEMVAACERRGRLLVVAHPWRGHPPIQRVAIPLIRSGRIGEPRLARIYGMGGRHGGDELFIDLAPHFFDFLWQLFGPPRWCQAHITQDGRSCTPDDVRPGAEGMGLVAGNGITAYYQFESCAAHFESYGGDGKENP